MLQFIKSFIGCILGVLLGCIIFGGGFTYASNPTQVNQFGYEGDRNYSTAADKPDETLETIDQVVKFLSWVWIIPASLAGELMTNEVIYGKAFYFEETLFRFWQFMRTLALYAVGFLFLYKIGETFVKGGDASSLGKTVLRTGAAAVLVPMSRWLIAALIDVSLIATAAVSSLPLEVMQELWQELELDGKVPVSKIIYVENYEIKPISNVTNNTESLEFSDLIPNGDSVAGTLVFMGAGIMRLDQSFSLVQGEAVERGSVDQLSSTFIRAIMIIMLVIPMIVLVVVNIVRVVYIWLWIVTVPFIIVDVAFDGPLSKQDTFKISNIMGLIFQPVVVVGSLSVGVLIIMGMYGALIGNEDVADQGMNELINVSIESDRTASIGGNGTSQVIVDGDIFGQTGDLVGGGIGRIVVSIFMIFLIWSLVKVGFSTSQLTKSISDGIYGFAEKMATAIPVVPVPGLPGAQSISSLSKAKQTLARNNPFEKKVNYEADEISNRIKGTLGMDTGGFGAVEERELTNSAETNIGKNAWNFRKDVKSIQAKKKGIPLNSNTRNTIVSRVMKSPAEARTVLKLSSLPSTREELDKLWDENNTDATAIAFRKAIHGILSQKVDEESTSTLTIADIQRFASGGSTDKLLPNY